MPETKRTLWIIAAVVAVAVIAGFAIYHFTKPADGIHIDIPIPKVNGKPIFQEAMHRPPIESGCARSECSCDPSITGNPVVLQGTCPCSPLCTCRDCQCPKRMGTLVSFRWPDQEPRAASAPENPTKLLIDGAIKTLLEWFGKKSDEAAIYVKAQQEAAAQWWYVVRMGIAVSIITGLLLALWACLSLQSQAMSLRELARLAFQSSLPGRPSP